MFRCRARSRRWAGCGAWFLVVAGPAFASAQPCRASVAVTYTWLRDAESDRDYSSGASADAAARVWRWVELAAEAAVSTAGQDFESVGGGTYDFRYESLHAGLRVGPIAGPVRPYAGLLAGVTRWRIRERRLDRTGWQSASDFSLQPGAGLDVLLTRRLALRLGADLRVLFKHDNRFDRDYRANLYRAHAGVSVHLGGS